jgi:hypothetical protein
MSRKGDCWDNAPMESFFGSLKTELDDAVFETRQAVPPAQAEALDALLLMKEGTPMSVLAWARQPPGALGHRALARVVEQRAVLRAIALGPSWAEGVHPERFRKLAREGARFTAQHLRGLSPLRRRATLVATALDTITRLTDDGVALFDRAVGRMFRRAEVREQDSPAAGRALDQRQSAPAGQAGHGVDRRTTTAATCRRRLRPRSAGTSSHAASRKPSAWPVPIKPIFRRSPRGPGRC